MVGLKNDFVNDKINENYYKVHDLWGRLLGVI